MKKTYVVEHLDPELGPWSALEYQTIAQECQDAGANFCLSGVSEDLKVPPELSQANGVQIERRASETIFTNALSSVCLLDPAAKQELKPVDGHAFDVFLFGGILGDDPPRGRT